MHEASLVLSIIALVNEKSQEFKADKVDSVTVTLGELACIEKNTLQACFETFVEGTNLEKTVILFEDIPAKGLCKTCNKTFSRKELSKPCPECQQEIQLVTGRELYVKCIDVTKDN